MSMFGYGLWCYQGLVRLGPAVITALNTRGRYKSNNDPEQNHYYKHKRLSNVSVEHLYIHHTVLFEYKFILVLILF